MFNELDKTNAYEPIKWVFLHKDLLAFEFSND